MTSKFSFRYIPWARAPNPHYQYYKNKLQSFIPTYCTVGLKGSIYLLLQLLKAINNLNVGQGVWGTRVVEDL